MADDTGAEISFGQPKQRALMTALLLSSDRPVRSRRLAELVWGETPPTSGALRTQLWMLRRRIAPAQRLQRTAAGYQLDVRPGELDLDVFRDLVAAGQRALGAGQQREAVSDLGRALGLWREPPLADVPSTCGMESVRNRLVQERQVATEGLIEAKLALGMHRDLLPDLQVHAAQDPTHEGVWAHLMLALYRCGRRAEALASFNRLRRVLVDEHGIDPGPTLWRLYQQILVDDPALRTPSAIAACSRAT